MAKKSTLKRIYEDALELAKAAENSGDRRAILRAITANDSFRILVTTRLREVARRYHIPLVNHFLRMAQTIVHGVEIGKEVRLGAGVYFVHPVGVVIGGDTHIGDRVRFYGNNTIGTAKDNGYPVIGDDVVVGAGARVLGPVRVGARAVIGANAVVLHDIPEDSVAVGAPAKVQRAKA